MTDIHERHNKVAARVWAIWTSHWTSHGIDVDVDARNETRKTVNDAVNNAYHAGISDDDWSIAAIKRLKGG